MPKAEDLGPEALAASLAAQLEHLRRYRGVHYVGSAPMPGMPETSVATPDGATPDASKGSESEVRSSGGPRESVGEVKKRVLRQQAAQWTPAKKLQYLREKNVGDCRRCRLAQGRQNLVFGVGSPEADIMFIGEAPGAEEDRRGEPFVGAAGRRLDEWIAAIGLRREDVYIANVLKCRPPGNRDPQEDEIESCSPFLRAQIRAIEPKVLVALGRFAGALLLGSSQRMYQMRGQVHQYVEEKTKQNVPLVVTYHPSYVLRSEKGPSRGPDNSKPRKSENDAVLADLRMAVKQVAATR